MSPRPAALGPQPAFRLHIERLVLEGLPFGAREAALLQSSLEAELARLAGGDVRALRSLAGGSLRALPAAEMAFDPAAGPIACGRQVAAAVFGRLDSGAIRGEATPAGRPPPASVVTR